MELVSHRITLILPTGPRVLNSVPLFLPAQVGWKLGPFNIDGQVLYGVVTSVTLRTDASFLDVEVSMVR